MRRRKIQPKELTFAKGKFKIIRKDKYNYQVLKQHFRKNKETEEKELYYAHFGYFSSLDICFRFLLKDSLIKEDERISMEKVLERIGTLLAEVKELGGALCGE